jgi:hypothetical protein
MRDLAPNMTDYLATRASFRLKVPEVYNYARAVVDARAAAEPDKLALLAVGPDGGDARPAITRPAARVAHPIGGGGLMTATLTETILTPEHHSLVQVRHGPNEPVADCLGSAAGVPEEANR